MASQKKHDLAYFVKCMFGGALACGTTHTLITPMDLIKCRKQQFSGIYNKSLKFHISDIYSKQSLSGIYNGWKPTLVGYSLQGLGKFGFYELFKDIYAQIMGPQLAKHYQKVGWCVASGAAEVLADILLCPWEKVKVVQQTDIENKFPKELTKGFNNLLSQKGIKGMYNGIVPLWCRQIPYTIIKFVAFEQFQRTFFSILDKKFGIQPHQCQLSVTFASGYCAGVLCAVISHPADTIVTKLSNYKGDLGSSQVIKKIYADMGFVGLLTKGLPARILMIGTLTGCQWYIYNTFKKLIGLELTGADHSSTPNHKMHH